MFSYCRNSEGHVELDKDEAASYVKYVQAARAARATFQQRRNTIGDSNQIKQTGNEAHLKEQSRCVNKRLLK